MKRRFRFGSFEFEIICFVFQLYPNLVLEVSSFKLFVLHFKCLRKTGTILEREKLAPDLKPDWLDFTLLTTWRSGDWTDPFREHLLAAENREPITCDGVTIVPWELKGA